jgi:TonB family protein
MSRTDNWRTWEGRVVDGKYPLRQWLGGSDRGAVFVTERNGERAAIKLIESQTSDIDRDLARLRNVRRLSHPNLISIFEAGRGQVDGTPVIYAVMEYADEDLSQILPQRPLNADEVSQMLPPLLDALSYLHGNGLVHGRVKPSNALAVGDQLKLSSDSVIPSGEPSIARRVIGVYDAPETSSGTVSPAADIWSLGVTLMAALTQKASAAAVGSLGDTVVPGSIPEPFRGIARECLHVDPKQRCSLDDIRARLQPAGRSVPAEPETPLREQSDKSRLPAFAIPLVLVVVALAAWGLFHSRGTSGPPASTTGNPQASAPVATPSPSTANPQPAQPAKNSTNTGAGGAVLHQVMPDIPQSAKNTVHGTIKVIIRVEADPSGKVASAKFKTSGSSRYFAGRAMNAAEKWEFTPPQVNGQPVASIWLVQFRFRRSGTEASSQRVNR